ncbi:hypothetical protein [Peribacillus cavernae]|uniref:hypothetical protein n=1 Tax=Peribacillus cavernae TaxID=1674310 RepID=UPI00277FE0CC|nr:hypothetical protein [Peribacillus cavernae]MDQ0221184.1 hypothetical protein [Peribacillus cavernae]
MHSSALDQRKQKKINRDVSNEGSKIEKSIKTWSGIEYHCHEDAAAQLEQHVATRLKYHRLTGEVKRMEKVKRRPGRPSKTVTAPVDIYYTCQFTVTEDEAQIKKAREMESTFVLISNVSHEREASCLGLLRRYM